MLPIAVDRAGTLIVGIDRIGDGVLIDSDPVCRSSEGVTMNVGRNDGAGAYSGALPQKISAADRSIFSSHAIILKQLTFHHE